MTKNSKRSGGFTLVELLVVIAIIALLVGILLPAVNRARKNAIQLKDSTQLRNIEQAFQQYAQTNREQYPLPSKVDARGDVLDDANSRNKMNTTGAIMSIIIFQQIITPEVCKSPAEVGRVDVMDDYKYEMNAQMADTGTVNPARAAWDPRFKGTPNDNSNVYGAKFTSGTTDMEPGVGHNSYAHNCYAAGRAPAWSNTYSASQPVWGTRGPVYAEKPDANTVWELDEQNVKQGSESPALEIFGNGGRWGGNLAFADGHVTYVNEPDPAEVTFEQETATGKKAINDNIFADEIYEGKEGGGLADSARRNIYMRQWTQGVDSSQKFTKDPFLTAPNGTYVYVDGDTINN